MQVTRGCPMTWDSLTPFTCQPPRDKAALQHQCAEGPERHLFRAVEPSIMLLPGPSWLARPKTRPALTGNINITTNNEHDLPPIFPEMTFANLLYPSSLSVLSLGWGARPSHQLI